MKKMLSLIVAIATLVCGMPTGYITESNISEYVKSDCDSVADFIEKNFELFVTEYNNALEDGNELKASYCELSIPVYITTLEQAGVYLDFNGDNGYMVIIDNYEVVAFETSGDLDYLKDLDYAYYSIYDGFVYKTDNETTCQDLHYFYNCVGYKVEVEELPHYKDGVEYIVYKIKLMW